MIDSSIFAERLAELMFDNKKTAEDLSKAVGVNLSLIYKYLKKRYVPSMPNVIKIADYFNCSIDFLVGLTDEASKVFCSEHKPFAICFQELLKKHNCTRYRLKKDTVLAKQSVDDWYNGVRVPSVDNLSVLAEYFCCSIDYIIGRVF